MTRYQFDDLLQKIREKPGLFLGKPSLHALWHFMNGYAMRDYELTGSSDHTIECSKLSCPHGFNMFVHRHFNRPYSTMCAEHLILTQINCDDEAFYKFFELLDEYLKHQG